MLTALQTAFTVSPALASPASFIWNSSTLAASLISYFLMAFVL